MPNPKKEFESFDHRLGWLRGRAKTEVLIPKETPILAMLVTVSSPNSGQVFRLDPNLPNTIGRDYSSDIVLDDPAVSRQHARIRADSDESGTLYFWIVDLATANGVLVNGARVTKHRLQDGDRIELGRTIMVYKLVYREQNETV